MKVAIVVGSFSRRGGGVFEVVKNLILYLGRDVEFHVICVKDEFVSDDLPRGISANLHFLRKSGDLLSMFGYLASIRPNVIHVHGLWMVYDFALICYIVRYKPRLFVTPHGMLEAWILSRNIFLKKIFFNLVDRWLLRCAQGIFALSDKEKMDVIAVDSSLANKVSILPNPVPSTGILEFKRKISSNIYLYLGRLHPKKNLLNLLEGWEIFVRNHPGEELLLEIAGWGDSDYIDLLKKTVFDKQLGESVFFKGAVFGENKRNTFAAAKFFLLPSLSEGVPMAPLEALSYACYPLLSEYCNLGELVDRGFSGSLAIDPAGIAICLEKTLLITDCDLESKIKGGQDYISGLFSEKSIGDKLLRFYRGVDGDY